MKHMLLSALLLTTTPTFAVSPVATTPLFQIPYMTNYTAHLSPAGQPLTDFCNQFRKMVYPGGQRRFIPSSLFSRLRSNPLEELQPTFEYEYKIELSSESVNDSLRFSQLAAEELQASDKIPFFTQSAKEINFEFHSLKNFKVSYTEDSLTQVGVDLGLGAGQVQSFMDGDSPVLIVKAKDLACDLLLGKAKILSQSSAILRIGMDNHLKLNDFYLKLSELGNRALSDRATIPGKAALFGYLTGNLLENTVGITSDQQKIEKLIEGLTEILYHPTSMERSKLWSPFSGKHFISVTGATRVNDLQIEMKQDLGAK